MQADALVRERDSLCDKVRELGKQQEENFQLKMALNQLKSGKAESQV